MPGLFTQAGRVFADTRRKTQELQQADADRKYQEEQRAIQRLAVMEGLRGQGLVPDQEAQQMRGAVQAAKASDFLTPGTDMSGVETPSVQQAGAGFSRVSTMTPEHRQQVMARRKQQDAEAQRGRRVAVLRAKKVGADDNERAAIAEDDSLYESYLKPQPPKRYSHVTTAEGVFSFDPETGNKGARIGGRPVAPRASSGSVSKGDTFEANWKGRRYQELVRGIVDRNTGVVMVQGLAPQAAQAKVQQEWEGLSKVIPPAYLKAAENDPEYAAYLRAQVGGGDPEEDQ